MNSLSRGKRADGDMIPWTVSQQFQDPQFAALSGARIVRIATHPDYQGMGYGGKAMQLLQQYFEGKFPSLAEDESTATNNNSNNDNEEVINNNDNNDEKDSEGDSKLLREKIVPRKKLPPLLLKLNERKPEKLDYLGVAFGLTESLLKFWRRNGFSPVYLRQTANELTGEHSSIMLRTLEAARADVWLPKYFADFSKRFLSLLSYQFR